MYASNECKYCEDFRNLVFSTILLVLTQIREIWESCSFFPFWKSVCIVYALGWHLAGSDSRSKSFTWLNISLPQAEYDTKSIYNQFKNGLNSTFLFSLTGCDTKFKESSQLYYVPIARGRNNGLMTFSRALALPPSSKIWTLISNVNNRNAKRASIQFKSVSGKNHFYVLQWIS